MKHTIEELKEVFSYSEDSPSGIIRNSTGKPYGSRHHSGRWNLIYQSKNYQVHRLVYALCHDKWPDKQIDHIDGNPLNNRIENLRDVDGKTNALNRKAKGYYFHKLSGKYQCQISMDGEWTNLGLYEDEELAALIAEEAKIKFHNPPVYQA